MVAIWVVLALGYAPAEADVCERGAVDVLAAEAWYRERPEPEASFSGVLRFNPPRVTRGERYHAFHCGEHPVYAGGPETAERMKPWTGQRVRIRGKLVGTEIWPGTIACATEPDAEF